VSLALALRLDLFCEDAGHEEFGRAAVERVARDQEVEVSIRVVSARAGLGHMQRELRAYAQAISHRPGTPDTLVVLADSNSAGPTARRREIEEIDLDKVFPVWVIGTPDPCVEAWLLADPTSLSTMFGHQPGTPASSDADELKRLLKAYLEDADEVVTQGGVEFADEIVVAMDLYRAGKAEPTLKRFLDDLQAALRN
jgi:hypothetical protein